MKSLQSENQVLCQQVLTMTPPKGLPPGGRMTIPPHYFQRQLSSPMSMENGYSSVLDRAFPESPLDPGDRQQSELELKRQKLLIDRQQVHTSQSKSGNQDPRAMKCLATGSPTLPRCSSSCNGHSRPAERQARRSMASSRGVAVDPTRSLALGE
jgi:hypothetical protein